MANTVKSFRKIQKQTGEIIEGTRPSPQNFSLLTSSGLSALDNILGGGLPIGSLLLIEEDEFGHYSEVLTKYFVSEGVHSGHRLLLGSKEADMNEMIKTLPGEIVDTKEQKPAQSEDNGAGGSGEDMTIAWRYKNLKITDSEIRGSSRLGHRLRLNVPIAPNVLKSAQIEKWPQIDVNAAEHEDFLSSLVRLLKNEEHQLGSGKRKVLRLALLGLGSPLWQQEDVARILYIIRSWLRRSVAVGIVTVPFHLYQDKDLRMGWEHLADICIRLESFCGTERATNPALKDHNGFLHVVKLPAFNSIAPHIPPSDLAFKLRRRHFTIERLSLPPELEDTTARSSVGCGSGTSSSNPLLDF